MLQCSVAKIWSFDERLGSVAAGGVSVDTSDSPVQLIRRTESSRIDRSPASKEAGPCVEKWLGVAHHSNHDVRVGDGRRTSGVVDHIQNPAFSMHSVEEEREDVVQAPGGKGGRNLKSVSGEDVDALVEERVGAHSISMEARNAVSNFEGRVAIDTGGLHPGRLARNVVRHFVLEEDVGAPVAVPPTRKKTSESTDGSEASLSLRAWPSPTRSKTGELTAPASNRTPETS